MPPISPVDELALPFTVYILDWQLLTDLARPGAGRQVPREMSWCAQRLAQGELNGRVNLPEQRRGQFI
jgi:hypothetical protein